MENSVSRAPLDSWFLHHHNAPTHQAFATQEFLDGIEVQLSENPAYISNLAPYNFGLFPRPPLDSGFLSPQSRALALKSPSSYLAASHPNKAFARPAVRNQVSPRIGNADCCGTEDVAIPACLNAVQILFANNYYVNVFCE